jgi:hypothetical protein
MTYSTEHSERKFGPYKNIVSWLGKNQEWMFLFFICIPLGYGIRYQFWFLLAITVVALIYGIALLESNKLYREEAESRGRQVKELVDVIEQLRKKINQYK